MIEPNPYASPPVDPESRPLFSGFPPFVKRAAVVIAICIAVIVAADAVWISWVKNNTASHYARLESVIGEDIANRLPPDIRDFLEERLNPR